MMRTAYLLLISSIFLGAQLHAQENKPRVAIVVSVYHETITSKLLEGATEYLFKNGLSPENISIAYVPGSFEIPYTVKLLAETRKFDAIICLGGIITAGNPGWTYVADQVSKNIAQISLIYNVPVTWGVMLFDSRELAQKEADQLESNDGWEAARAALAMVALTQQIIQFAQLDPNL